LTIKGKILYVGVVLDKNWLGGEPIIAKDTIDKLRHLGYLVSTSYYNETTTINKNGKLNFLKIFSYSNLRSLYLISDKFNPAVKYYRKIIKKENPDVIIAQYDYDTSIIEAAKKENKKIIVYVHIWWPICPIITLYKYNKEICNGFLSNKCKECVLHQYNTITKSSKFVNKIASYALKMVAMLFVRNSNLRVKMKNRIKNLNFANSIVVYSNQMKNLFSLNGVREEKLSIIPNGVDCGEFTTAREQRQKIVLYAGGNGELKGYRFFIKIAENIKKTHPEVRFIAAGWFNGSDMNQKCIEYLGVIERKKLLELMSISRVTVVPSVWNEPFSMVTIESMASGTPVVAFDVGILKEIIGDGVGGFIVDVGDVKKATEKIIDLLTNDLLFMKISRNARQRVCEIYSNNRRIALLDNLIQNILKSDN